MKISNQMQYMSFVWCRTFSCTFIVQVSTWANKYTSTKWRVTEKWHESHDFREVPNSALELIQLNHLIHRYTCDYHSAGLQVFHTIYKNFCHRRWQKWRKWLTTMWKWHFWNWFITSVRALCITIKNGCSSRHTHIHCSILICLWQLS